MTKNRTINSFDAGCLIVVLLCLISFALARAGHAGVDKVIEGVSKVSIDVYITGLKTRDLDLFKVGDKASITVRNQPIQPPMTITKVEHNPKQACFLSPDGKKVVSFADPTQPVAHDFYVTVVDDAEKTKDGFVVRGQKIKVGNQIELEGFKYRAQGVVVDIHNQ